MSLTIIKPSHENSKNEDLKVSKWNWTCIWKLQDTCRSYTFYRDEENIRYSTSNEILMRTNRLLRPFTTPCRDRQLVRVMLRLRRSECAWMAVVYRFTMDLYSARRSPRNLLPPSRYTRSSTRWLYRALWLSDEFYSRPWRAPTLFWRAWKLRLTEQSAAEWCHVSKVLTRVHRGTRAN